MQWTVTFQRPSQGFSYERVVVWQFPFTVVDSSLAETPEEWSRTLGYMITVSATVELVLAWEFGFVLNPDNGDLARMISTT